MGGSPLFFRLLKSDENKQGIHSESGSFYAVGMDTLFDDLSSALREPRTDAWAKVRVIALDLAGKLFTGAAIGVGFAIVHAFAG